jgi:hypothetical protein
MNQRIGGVVLAVAITSAACAQVDSKDVNSSGVYAELNVTASGDGTSLAKAALKVGGGLSNTFLSPSAGDTLTATSGGAMRALERRDVAGALSYEATFPTDAAGTSFVFDFTRAMGASAPGSEVTLPAPFTISEPTATATISRAAPLRVAWTPAGTSDRMRWTLVGECIVPGAGDISGDPGSFVIDANRVLALDPKAGTTCPVTVEVVRTRAGRLSTGYGKGGTIQAHQRRTVTFRSAP